jgi:hypothetical protein
MLTHLKTASATWAARFIVVPNQTYMAEWAEALSDIQYGRLSFVVCVHSFADP